ncbi:MAG: histidine--tRNA ligase [Burkholderiales bacterium]|nr:histidine--tRNA ligase [Burkholderiales bacterium]
MTQEKVLRATRLSGVKGMNDLLPADGPFWHALERHLAGWLDSYGYVGMRTPVLEQTTLFRRGIGEVTDIVEKEMFSFTDRLNGDELTMRPEFTAGIVRAAVEHNLLYNGPQRVYSIGPVFRHERPQRGRYRQFHQVDVEALGFAGPDVDAELIIMARRLWNDLGLKEVRLELNTLGSPAERQAHRAALITHFERHAAVLDEDARRRLHSNPLRILDSKNPAMQEIVEAAPRLDAYLGAESRAHFDGLQSLLADAGVEYRINPRLVRGLDYYNLTVFEWITSELGSQGTICGGGRYDGLIELFGGKPAPAIGFAIGMERLVELARRSADLESRARCDVYVAHAAQDAAKAARLAFRAAEALRDCGIDVVTHCGGGSFKSQMKKADASGAELAVLIGDDEASAGEVSVKPLRREAGQERIAIDKLAERVIALLPSILPSTTP